MAENSDPVPETGGGSAPFLLRLRVWARRWRLSHKLAFLLAGAALISVVMTVLAMTQTTSGSGPDPDRVLKLLYLDVVLLVALGAVVLRRVTALWLERRKGGAGAGLHIRFVVLFSLIAVVPTLVVFGFSAFFLNFGLQAWFSDRVATAITESVEVARAYRDEHRLSIRADTLAMANDLNRDAPDLVRSQRYFHQVLDNQAAVRGLTEAIVIDGNGRILARSRYSFAIEMEIQTLLSSLGPDKEIAIVNSVYDDRVRAIVRLSRFVDAFLIVGRVVDARVLDHIAKAEGASSEYQALNKRREGIQITFVAIFTVVALIILLAAV
ncbi:MAG: two-component sensor histidine kinase, partial [Rhodospirillales bacterium]